MREVIVLFSFFITVGIISGAMGWIGAAACILLMLVLINVIKYEQHKKSVETKKQEFRASLNLNRL